MGLEYNINFDKVFIGFTGNYYYELGYKKEVDFYIIKGIIEELLHFLGFNNRFSFEIGEFPSEFHG